MSLYAYHNKQGVLLMRMHPLHYLTVCLSVLLTHSALAVNAESDSALILEEIVVTATRTEKPLGNAPGSVSYLSAEDLINEHLSRTIPEALKVIPGVMVQKTAHGQGSPYIRGFTSMRTLFLIDGIRLNNSVFREGPNQYWNTVDPLSLDALEIVKGPGSVLFGSDAVGGMVSAVTGRLAMNSPSPYLDVRSYLRVAGAEESMIGRMAMEVGLGRRAAIRVGLSPKSFGDLRSGGELGTQPKTGYREFDGDVKAEVALSENIRLVTAHQQVHQDDIWRTHKTIYGLSWEGTTVNDSTGSKYELKRVLEQDRSLTYAQLHAENFGILSDRFGLSVSYHHQSEVQERERVRRDAETGAKKLKPDEQGVSVGTFGCWVQNDKKTPLGLLTVGGDVYYDDVSSYK
ncbi:MAG: TonB-dependent receptor plug domain-containing protein, partial [Chitinivibrionales bacterium]|nr:TonB-dependent receptor plug domain-containing protein [Chitinivibrionales bacterium]MBD3358694.1 TonB-dependent receptor plug domain-containing protein [Chitinivibrionales bacterium]